MKLRTLAIMVGVSSMLALAACSSDSTDGDGTGGSGASGEGGSGNTGNEGGSGNSGNQGGTGVGGGTGGTGSGGGPDCLTCADYATNCAVEEPEAYCATTDFCDGSEDLFDAVLECVCTECADECTLSCTNQGADTADCPTCQGGAITGACSTAFGECSNDL